jgi:hypothetical protein
MAIINNSQPKKFRVMFFVLLTSLGLSRCLSDLVYYPELTLWAAWLIPRPQVFVDRHYQLQKRIVIQKKNGQQLSFDLRSEDQWPVRDSLLIFSYTLVHCLDRPQLIEKNIWQSMVRFHFCETPDNQSILKNDIKPSEIQSVVAYIGQSEESLKIVREVKCLN